MLKMNISRHFNSENLLIKVVTLKVYMAKKQLMLIWKALQKNALFLSGISFVLEIDVFELCKLSDVIMFAIKMVKYWIKNISENVKAVFFKLCTELCVTKETKWRP